MNLRQPLAIVSIVAVLALAGCATATEEPAASPEPTASVSTDPTPSPTPTAPVEGVVAFDGDCDNVLTAAQVESILGAGALPFEEWILELRPDYRLEAHSAIERAGGIACRWMAADDAAGLPEGMTEIAIVALPRAATSPTQAVDLEEPVCEPQYDAVSCRLGRTAGEVWLMSRVGAYVEDAPESLMIDALDLVEGNLSAYPTPVAAAQDASWWAIDQDCQQIGQALDLADLLGPDYFTGYYEGSPQRENFLLEHAGVQQVCQWSSDSMNIPDGERHYIVTLTIEPGGAWRWDDFLADDREPARVTGATEALRLLEDEEDSIPIGSVWTTDGVNVLTVNVTGGDVDAEIAARALALLG